MNNINIDDNQKPVRIIQKFIEEHKFHFGNNPNPKEISEYLCFLGADKLQWWNISVFDHIKRVVDVSKWIALRINKRGSVSIDTYRCECLAQFHDVGRLVWAEISENEKVLLFHHGFAGYLLLSEMGFPDDLAIVSMTHICGGISKIEIEKENIDIPLRDYLSTSIEENIVSLADKLMWWDDTVDVAYTNYLKNGSGKIYGELKNNDIAWQRFIDLKRNIDLAIGEDILDVFKRSYYA